MAMYCTACGNPIKLPHGQNFGFCGKCGTRAEAVNVSSQVNGAAQNVSLQANDAQTVVFAEDNAGLATFGEAAVAAEPKEFAVAPNEFAVKQKPKRPVKKGVVAAIIAGAVGLTAGAAVLFTAFLLPAIMFSPYQRAEMNFFGAVFGPMSSLTDGAELDFAMSYSPSNSLNETLRNFGFISEDIPNMSLNGTFGAVGQTFLLDAEFEAERERLRVMWFGTGSEQNVAFPELTPYFLQIMLNPEDFARRNAEIDERQLRRTITNIVNEYFRIADDLTQVSRGITVSGGGISVTADRHSMTFRGEHMVELAIFALNEMRDNRNLIEWMDENLPPQYPPFDWDWGGDWDWEAYEAAWRNRRPYRSYADFFEQTVRDLERDLRNDRHLRDVAFRMDVYIQGGRIVQRRLDSFNGIDDLEILYRHLVRGNNAFIEFRMEQEDRIRVAVDGTFTRSGGRWSGRGRALYEQRGWWVGSSWTSEEIRFTVDDFRLNGDVIDGRFNVDYEDGRNEGFSLTAEFSSERPNFFANLFGNEGSTQHMELSIIITADGERIDLGRLNVTASQRSVSSIDLPELQNRHAVVIDVADSRNSRGDWRAMIDGIADSDFGGSQVTGMVSLALQEIIADMFWFDWDETFVRPSRDPRNQHNFVGGVIGDAERASRAADSRTLATAINMFNSMVTAATGISTPNGVIHSTADMVWEGNRLVMELGAPFNMDLSVSLNGGAARVTEIILSGFLWFDSGSEIWIASDGRGFDIETPPAPVTTPTPVAEQASPDLEGVWVLDDMVLELFGGGWGAMVTFDWWSDEEIVEYFEWWTEGSRLFLNFYQAGFTDEFTFEVSQGGNTLTLTDEWGSYSFVRETPVIMNERGAGLPPMPPVSSFSPADLGNVTVSMRWWGGDSRAAAVEAALDLFEDRYPNVTVVRESEVFAGYFDALIVYLAAGMEPDIMQVNYAWVHEFGAGNNVFLNLNTVAHILDLTEWLPELRNLMTTADGQLAAVPHGITGRVMVYNRHMLAAHGLDTFPQTIDELIAYGQAVAQGNVALESPGNTFAFTPLGPEALDIMVLTWLYNNTGRNLQANGEMLHTVAEVETVFNTLGRMINAGVIPTPAQEAPAPNTNNPVWMEGRSGSSFEWVGNIFLSGDRFMGGDLDGLGVALVPSLSGESRNVLQRPSLGHAISRNTDNPELAAYILNFLYTDEQALEILGNEFGIPVPRTANSVARRLGNFAGLQAFGFELLEDNFAEMCHWFENGALRSPRFDAIESFRNGQLNAREAAEMWVTGQQAALTVLIASR